MHVFLDKGLCKIIKCIEGEFDGSNPYMEFGRKLIKTALVCYSDLLRPSCLSFNREKNVFKLEREFDESNPYMKFGYNLDIMRQSACLVLNPITVYSYGFLFNCTTVGQASDSMTALT